MINEMIGKYTVARLTTAGLKGLAVLYHEVYGRPAPVGYFENKYSTGFTGRKNIGFIASENDRPVAYYGVTPCFLVNGSEKILAAQSVDTMTHPAHRRKNLFTELARRTFELCREEGIRIIYGFPNQNSIQGFQKMGWTRREDMEVFQLELPLFSFPSLARKAGWIRTETEKLNQRIGIGSSVVSEGFIGVDRNEAFLEYRRFQPTQVIEVDGSNCWVSLKENMIIGDMEGYDDQNFDSIMEYLVKTAKKAGMRNIQFHCSPGTKLHRLFSSRYASRRSFAVIFLDLGSNLQVENIKFTFADTDLF